MVAGWVVVYGIVWLACVVWVAIDAGRHGISPVFWPFVTRLPNLVGRAGLEPGTP